MWHLPSLSRRLQAAHVRRISLTLFNFLCLSYTSPQRGAALSRPVAVCDPPGPLFEAHACPSSAADCCCCACSQARIGDGALHGAGTGRGLGQQAEDHGRGGEVLIDLLCQHILNMHLMTRCLNEGAWVICNTENNIFRLIQFCMSEVPVCYYIFHFAWLYTCVSNYIYHIILCITCFIYCCVHYCNIFHLY